MSTLPEPGAREAIAKTPLPVSRDQIRNANANMLPKNHSWRFWCVFLALCLISFVCSIDATMIVTALPAITRDIGSEEQYIYGSPIHSCLRQPHHNFYLLKSPISLEVAIPFLWLFAFSRSEADSPVVGKLHLC